MTTRSDRRTPSKDRGTPGEGASRVPLWRDAHEVEAALRPVVPPRSVARAPLPWLHLAVGTAAVGGAAIAASVLVYRRGLVIARLQRPRQLQGAPIAPLPRFVAPRVVAAGLPWAGSALGVGLALWLLTLAIPRWRGAMWRWGWMVGLVGVATYAVLTLRMMVPPR